MHYKKRAKYKIGDVVRAKASPALPDLHGCLRHEYYMQRFAGKEYTIIRITEGHGISGVGYVVNETSVWFNEELFEAVFDEADVDSQEITSAWAMLMA